MLDDLSYQAINAADSLSGLKILRSDVHIDLLITDVGPPGGMNGRQMADSGREACSNLKVLVCGSAWKKDPSSGVIGVQKGPLIPMV